MVHASGDLAYTVGFERGPVSVDGRPEQEMVIRVTHIYRASATSGCWCTARDFPRATRPDPAGSGRRGHAPGPLGHK